MVAKLIEMYRAGAITGYQLMMDCLHMLDPNHPELVLNRLPGEVLEEMLDYTRRYDPSCMRSNAGLPPALDQVQAAQRWIEELRRQQADRDMALSGHQQGERK
jgi:hypothetical protein